MLLSAIMPAHAHCGPLERGAEKRHVCDVTHRFRSAGLRRRRAKAILANEQVIEGARTVLMDQSVLFAAPAAIIGVGESATAT
jgi:hypothetical protein